MAIVDELMFSNVKSSLWRAWRRQLFCNKDFSYLMKSRRCLMINDVIPCCVRRSSYLGPTSSVIQRGGGYRLEFLLKIIFSGML